MTRSELIKEIIGGICFGLFFFALIGATAFVKPLEDYIIEMRQNNE